MNGQLTDVMALGTSYLPLHQEALAAARALGDMAVFRGKTRCAVPNAAEEIQKAVDKGRVGFKRKHVRC